MWKKEYNNKKVSPKKDTSITEDVVGAKKELISDNDPEVIIL